MKTPGSPILYNLNPYTVMQQYWGEDSMGDFWAAGGVPGTPSVRPICCNRSTWTYVSEIISTSSYWPMQADQAWEEPHDSVHTATGKFTTQPRPDPFILPHFSPLHIPPSHFTSPFNTSSPQSSSPCSGFPCSGSSLLHYWQEQKVLAFPSVCLGLLSPLQKCHKVFAMCISVSVECASCWHRPLIGLGC